MVCVYWFFPLSCDLMYNLSPDFISLFVLIQSYKFLVPIDTVVSVPCVCQYSHFNSLRCCVYRFYYRQYFYFIVYNDIVITFPCVNRSTSSHISTFSLLKQSFQFLFYSQSRQFTVSTYTVGFFFQFLVSTDTVILVHDIYQYNHFNFLKLLKVTLVSHLNFMSLLIHVDFALDRL